VYISNVRKRIFENDWRILMSEATNNKNNISRHILPTSSNLLGLCFVMLSFIKLSKLGHALLIDKLVALSIIFFLISSLLSYASMRSQRWSESFEKSADAIFIGRIVSSLFRFSTD
jgi:hypothetical protein